MWALFLAVNDTNRHESGHKPPSWAKDDFWKNHKHWQITADAHAKVIERSAALLAIDSTILEEAIEYKLQEMDALRARVAELERENEGLKKVEEMAKSDDGAMGDGYRLVQKLAAAQARIEELRDKLDEARKTLERCRTGVLSSAERDQLVRQTLSATMYFDEIEGAIED